LRRLVRDGRPERARTATWQDTVDALRLLCDPQRAERTGHKFKLISVHPAANAHCSTVGGPAEPPRLVVTEAPPRFASWSSDSSFPHG
jgi:hypothetical protein